MSGAAAISISFSSIVHISTTVSGSFTRHSNFLPAFSAGVPYDSDSATPGRPAHACFSFSKPWESPAASNPPPNGSGSESFRFRAIVVGVASVNFGDWQDDEDVGGGKIMIDDAPITDPGAQPEIA